MKKQPPTTTPKDSHRIAVRRLIRGSRSAALAATAASGSPAGSRPYVSLVTMANDHDGSPILLLSSLADHTRALESDPRLALLVEEASGLPNPQTGERASLIGNAERVADPVVRERLSKRFLARHPAAAMYAGFGDFAFWKVTIEHVHYVGGFARAVWMAGDPHLDPDLAAAFAAAEADVIDHMNHDHPDAVDLLASKFSNAAEGGWRLGAADAWGMDLVRDDETVHVPFEPHLTSPDEFRSRLVALMRSCRKD